MSKTDEIILEIKKEFQIFLIKNNLYEEFKEIIKKNISNTIKLNFINKIKNLELKEYAIKILKEVRGI